MQTLTDDAPKCLVSLCGKTLLNWQRSAITAAGLFDLTVICGYKKEQLKSRKRYAVIENAHWYKSNIVVSLLTAKHLLREQSCIVSYSDIVYHPDIIKTLINAPGDIVITADQLWKSLWQERFLNPLDDAETFTMEGNRLLDIGAKPVKLSEVQAQYMGLLKFTPAGWEKVELALMGIDDERRDQLDITGLLRIILHQHIIVNVALVAGRWCEVDQESDLSLYESIAEGHRATKLPWQHDWRW